MNQLMNLYAHNE